MRTEIRLSTSTEASPSPWFWRVWDQGRLVARGQSPTEEEAQEAVRAVVGHDPRNAGPKSPSAYRPPSSR